MSGSEFATWFNPLLKALRELGGSARPREVSEKIARDLSLPDKVLDQTLQNGVSRYENQVHWARFYLAKAGYIDSSEHGVWRLTDRGRAAGSFSKQDLEDLIADVQATTSRQPTRRRIQPGIASASGTTVSPASSVEATAPEEALTDYKASLLALLKTLPPSGFERLCQRLLREAGFEQVTVTGRSGDGGIDGHGVLSLNSFVSFKVLFQCKRYEGSVTPGHVRDFRGAMQGRADKGIILTTGTFTVDARREAVREGVPPIELVDGDKLVSLFEKLELGLKPRKTFEVDDSFFSEYRA